MNPSNPESTERRPRPARLAITLILFLCALAPQVRAQFASNLALPKTNFLSLEPMQATVTITNRSGADVVMTGSNQSNWLTFEVTDSIGRTVAPAGVVAQKPFIFKAGTTIAEKVIISDHYGIDQLGTYGIIANVYHPPSKQFYASNRVRFSIMDAKPFWEAPVGVPAGYPDAGRIRRYALTIFRDVDRSNLYFRLFDDRSNHKLATFEIGPISSSVDPEATLDHNNMLHAFFLALPKVYCYAIIGPDGKLKKREYYREVDSNRPAMLAGGDGVVAVRGGVLFDPSAPPPARSKGRNVSDRPPGL
jgi:hypothetical protein